MKRASAIDGAIPARVVAALRAEIIDSPPKSDGTHWYSLAEPARLLFEQTIQHLRRFVSREFVGAEWWFRAASTDTGFPFHFDRDEGIRGSIVSPDLTSILYLSDTGGPTVVVDATPTRATPRAGVAVHPRAGRFGMFSGAMLHGVLPTRASRWPRVTMMVNWWRAKPRMESAPVERGWARATREWREVTPRVAPIQAIEPSTLMAKSAWRDLIAKQATYR